MAATAEQLTRTLTSKKRNLTRHVNAAGKTIAYALLHPTEDAATAVRQAQDRVDKSYGCLLYTSPSPRDKRQSRMPSSA